MAKTPSTMLPLGTPAPAFNLPDTRGHLVGNMGFHGKKGLLVLFICNHCPFVVHVRDELARLGKEYSDREIGVVAINSNNIQTHPDDSPEKMVEEVEKVGYTFPYLYDETQEVAKAYQAACTPDIFLFDGDQRLYYRGQLDDSRPSNNLPVDGKDLRNALESLLRGTPPPEVQKASLGCNIKWKPGNEPSYYGIAS